MPEFTRRPIPDAQPLKRFARSFSGHQRLCSFAERLRYQPDIQGSEPGAIKQPPIDAGLRALDGHRADGFRIVGRRAYPPDDGVAEAVLPHVLKADEQQARAYSVFSHLGLHAGRAEKIAARRVMASESHDPTFLDRDEAG